MVDKQYLGLYSLCEELSQNCMEIIQLAGGDLHMLDLNELGNGFPAITPAFGKALAEAGAICLDSQGHEQGVLLQVQGDHNSRYSLAWPAVTGQMQKCWNDLDVATEHGAIGIAILLIKKVIGHAPIQRSRKGTGFDYWMGDDSPMPFQSKARLEISRIRHGATTT